MLNAAHIRPRWPNIEQQCNVAWVLQIPLNRCCCPAPTACFQIRRKPPTHGLSLAVLETSKWRPPLSRLLDTWRPGNGKQKQHQWQCVQRCVPGLPEHSLLTERVHVQLASYRFVLKLGTSWHNDVLHATPKPNLFHRSHCPPRLDGSPWQPPLNRVAVSMSKRCFWESCFLTVS